MFLGIFKWQLKIFFQFQWVSGGNSPDPDTCPKGGGLSPLSLPPKKSCIVVVVSKSFVAGHSFISWWCHDEIIPKCNIIFFFFRESLICCWKGFNSLILLPIIWWKVLLLEMPLNKRSHLNSKIHCTAAEWWRRLLISIFNKTESVHKILL